MEVHDLDNEKTGANQRSIAMTKLIVLLLFVFLLAPAGQAQEVPTFQYAVKFVCGAAEGRHVAPGQYFTAVNVHNPMLSATGFRWKVATALSLGAEGSVSNFVDAKLKPDGALEVDCPYIFRMLRATSGFAKGFVVIESGTELDVTAVYTAAGRTQQVESIDVERIPPRRRSECSGPDLIVENIANPTWEDANRRSVITVTIRNVGNMDATASLARVIDPSTPQPTGVPYNDVKDTPALAPGAVATVTFYLPYWVFNPDATLEVPADYKNMVKECREDNNVQMFQRIG